jgi:hypothetical protein
LLGAEFTKVYASKFGSDKLHPLVGHASGEISRSVER